MAAYTAIDNPELYFQVKAYTGTDASPQAFTLDGDENMQPDLVWIKNRGYANKNVLFDSVRGVNKSLTSDSTAAEVDQNSDGGYVSAFGSDGFTLTEGSSSDNDTNDDRYTYVAWCWKANGSGSANTTGSVNTTKTSANTTSGFSIVLYDPSGSDPSTLGHGLGAVPKVILTKVTDQSGDAWKCYFSAVGNDKVMQLNLSDAEASSDAWNATTPTSTVFSLGNDGATNGSGRTVVAYCFAEKQGFSKFGSYTGNGNADGSYIHLGFRPAWFMQKNTQDTGDNWHIFDTKRDTGNQTDEMLFANATSAEATGNAIDLLSNGVKIRNTSNGMNGSGDNYIFMAFAEQPFVNSNGVPCNAR